jgi:hypothetical protein
MSWVQVTTVPRERGDGRPIVHGGRVVWFRSEGGLTYDPQTNEWRYLETPAGWRDGGIVASIGDDLIVWSGMYPGNRIDATGTSHPISKAKQPSVRKSARYAWTGRELVVWGGWDQKPPRQPTPRLNGAAYDPARDSWRKLPAKNAPATPNGRHVWTGREFWIWGGGVKQQGTWKAFSAGHAYDPAADRWRALADIPGDTTECFGVVRVADSSLLVRADDATCAAWRYAPGSDRWQTCAPPPERGDGPPRLFECDDRIVLLLGGHVFEYVVARDAWARLPRLPIEPHHLLWFDGALLAFLGDGTVYRLALTA